jgi:hypothetical protein
MTIPDSKSEAGKRRLPLNSDAMLAYGILLERATKLGISSPEFYVFPACENLSIDGTRSKRHGARPGAMSRGPLDRGA